MEELITAFQDDPWVFATDRGGPRDPGTEEATALIRQFGETLELNGRTITKLFEEPENL